MMSKKIFIITVIIFAAIAVIALWKFYSINSSTKKTLSSPDSSLQKQSIPLSVISTDPPDGADNVPLDKKLIISFNREFVREETQLSLAPYVPYISEIRGKDLIVNPQKGFLTGTLHTFTVKFADSSLLPKSYSFTATGPKQEFLPDTHLSDAPKIEENFQKQNHPDVFLSNQTPFENEYFSAVSEFKDLPTGHFSFRITSKGNDTNRAKTEFLNWLKSWGLTEIQINNLDIEYKSL